MFDILRSRSSLASRDKSALTSHAGVQALACAFAFQNPPQFSPFATTVFCTLFRPISTYVHLFQTPSPPLQFFRWPQREPVSFQGLSRRFKEIQGVSRVFQKKRLFIFRNGRAAARPYHIPICVYWRYLRFRWPHCRRFKDTLPGWASSRSPSFLARTSCPS